MSGKAVLFTTNVDIASGLLRLSKWTVL